MIDQSNEKNASYSKYKLEENEDLAEFISIILGDGGIYIPPVYNSYTLTISLNGIDEKQYVDYVKRLIYRLYHIHPHEHQKKNEKTVTLNLHNKKLINSLILKGLVPGDKVKNQVDVPKWIKNCIKFIPKSLKGLFDTDGSVWVHFNHKSIYLSFRNASYPLINTFKEMFEMCDIKPQPKITEFHGINDETGEDIYGYQIFISSKFYVKKFLKTVKPEKWKDRNRRSYLGTILILLNSEISIKEKIFSQIERDFPKESDRRYSVKYANYLFNLCVKYGCVINNKTIEKAIKEALEYSRPFYNREDAERLKTNFEQLGTFQAVREYEINQGNMARKVEQISKHIRLLFQEPDFLEKYGQNGHQIWLSKNRNMVIDSKNLRFKQFQFKNKKLICGKIFQIITGSPYNLSDNEIILKLKNIFYHMDLKRILFLLEDPQFKPVMVNFLKKYIKLIKFILINKDDLKKPTKIWRILELSGKQSHVKKIIAALIEDFPDYF